MVVFSQHAVHDAADGCPDEGGDPEDPQLSYRPASDKECRARAAGRIYRGIGNRDVDQVDKCQT